MANYIASARSNYFAVKDGEKFQEAMGEIPDLEVSNDEQGRFCLLCVNADGAGWSLMRYNEATDDYEELDLFALVGEHLAEGEVAVFMEAGAEKLRYVTGHAVAINAAGEMRTVNLLDIYGLAKELGPNVTAAEY